MTSAVSTCACYIGQVLSVTDCSLPTVKRLAHPRWRGAADRNAGFDAIASPRPGQPARPSGADSEWAKAWPIRRPPRRLERRSCGYVDFRTAASRAVVHKGEYPNAQTDERRRRAQSNMSGAIEALDHGNHPLGSRRKSLVDH